jgi:hypothetical protein
VQAIVDVNTQQSFRIRAFPPRFTSFVLELLWEQGTVMGKSYVFFFCVLLLLRVFFAEAVKRRLLLNASKGKQVNSTRNKYTS